MEQLDDIIKEFLVESYENLDQLDRDLVALEDAPDDRSRLSSVFRVIHTIKGTCGFLGFTILEHVTHVGESLLVRLRDGELRLDGQITNGLLAMVDAVRTILSTIETIGTEGTDHYASLVETLDQLRSGQSVPSRSTDASVGARAINSSSATGSASVVSVAEASGTEDRVCASVDDLERLVADLEGSSSTAKRGKQGRKPASRKAAGRSSKSNVASPSAADIKGGRSSADAGDSNAESPDPAESVSEPPSTAMNSRAVSPRRETAQRVGNVGASTESDGTSESTEKSQAVTETTVRLDVSLLDRLMNLVGELVLARNQIVQISQAGEDAALIAASQRLNLITTELQEGVMKTRMQPIRNAWSKLPRVVRDLAQCCRKKVNVQMDGADTELDKTILEAIKDPLTHIVRNSVDHGIEPSEVRVARGKPAEGTLWLRAFHEGGQVNIEISDDGAGIRLDRVRAKGIERGLITAEQAKSMSDQDVMQLILLPGFSTADKVTNVSGRGVGMDVVKNNVEKIGGTLDISSVEGLGTTLRMKIPLTLAIVPALVVTCDGDRYCIPQVSLLELVRLDGDRVSRDIEQMHSVPVYRLRGRLLPLVYLDEELGLRRRRTDAERRAAEVVNIVVLQAETRQFGLLVDHITDTQEIVVKPLGQHLKGIDIYAGSTIMGDGNIALILDVVGIARQGHVLTEHGRRATHEGAAKPESTGAHRSYLIVDPGNGSRCAVALSSVARLEEFRADQIEKSGGRTVVQYRGKIMPLVGMDGGFSGADENGTLSVVVYREGEQNVGVMVGRILDIVSHDRGNDDEVASGIPQIIAGRVTQIVDLRELICA